MEFKCWKVQTQTNVGEKLCKLNFSSKYFQSSISSCFHTLLQTIKSSFLSREEWGVFVVLNNYLRLILRKDHNSSCYFFTFPINLIMRFKLRKSLQEFNFACWINKELVNLRFETNSVKFNNFTSLKCVPFDVYRSVRPCILPPLTPSLNKL